MLIGLHQSSYLSITCNCALIQRILFLMARKLSPRLHNGHISRHARLLMSNFWPIDQSTYEFILLLHRPNHTPNFPQGFLQDIYISKSKPALHPTNRNRLLTISRQGKTSIYNWIQHIASISGSLSASLRNRRPTRITQFIILSPTKEGASMYLRKCRIWNWIGTWVLGLPRMLRHWWSWCYPGQRE